MNYNTFKEYLTTLDSSLMRLDDLNPFEMQIPSSSEKQISFTDWIKYCNSEIETHFYNGLGVRHLLEEIYKKLSKSCSTLILPTDVYPVYKKISQNYFSSFINYKTYPVLSLDLPEINNVVLLIPNPLIPVGCFLTDKEFEIIKTWMDNGNNRNVIIDACYNFTGKTSIHKLIAENSFEIFSASKLFLKNKSAGVLITKRDFDTWNVENTSIQITPSNPKNLQEKFNQKWEELQPLLQSIDPNWKAPEQAYLSLIKSDYKTLKEVYNIAAIPTSIFESSADSYSVLSILSLLK